MTLHLATQIHLQCSRRCRQIFYIISKLFVFVNRALRAVEGLSKISAGDRRLCRLARVLAATIDRGDGLAPFCLSTAHLSIDGSPSIWPLRRPSVDRKTRSTTGRKAGDDGDDRRSTDQSAITRLLTMNATNVQNTERRQIMKTQRVMQRRYNGPFAPGLVRTAHQ